MTKEIVLRGHGNYFYINLMSPLLVVGVVENRLCFFPLNFHSMAGIGGLCNPPCATFSTGFISLQFEGKLRQTASHKSRVKSSWVSGYFPSHISQQNVSMMELMSSISCSRCTNISSLGFIRIGTKWRRKCNKWRL